MLAVFTNVRKVVRIVSFGRHRQHHVGDITLRIVAVEQLSGELKLVGHPLVGLGRRHVAVSGRLFESRTVGEKRLGELPPVLLLAVDGEDDLVTLLDAVR